MVSTASLLDGDAGTLQTLDLLSSLVRQHSGSPAVRSAVVEALRGAPRGEDADLRGLLAWVRDHTRFTRDPIETELVHSPAVMLDTIRRDGVFLGDCDDLSVLLATLAEGAGYGTRFRVQGPDGGDYTHVLVDVQTPQGWVSLDPSNPTAEPGWAPSVGVGRESTMRHLGQDYGPEEFGSPIDGTVDFSGVSVVSPLTEVVPTAPVVADASASWWAELTRGITSVAGSVLPLAEAYGGVRRVIGWNADGTPRYAASTLPLSAGSAGYTSLTQPVAFGLSLPVLALVGVGVFLLLKRR